MAVTGRGGICMTSGWGNVLLVSVYEGVRRTTSPLQVSKLTLRGNIISSSLLLRLILTIHMQTSKSY